MNVDNEPVRMGQQKSVVARELVHFEHDPGAARLRLRHSNLLQEAVVDVESLAHQRRSEGGIAQVEKNAVRVRDALRGKLYLFLDVDGDASVVRRGPVANTSHSRQHVAGRAGGGGGIG